jgi:predicted RNA-binding protein with PUA-like domain
MAYWLMKSEPDVFGIEDLKACPGQTEHWDGVRNYQARNMMRDEMKTGDQVFFYHSNCKVPGIVGIAEVVREGYPDFTALEPEGKYFDPRASEDNPRWFMVDIRFLRQFERTVSLEALKAEPALEDWALVRKGNRLSVMPVTASQWQTVLDMADA